MHASRLAALAFASALLLAASAADASVVVTSSHKQTFRVGKDPRAYARVGSGAVFQFEAIGPGTLTLRVRQEASPRVRLGRTSTRISVVRDGERVLAALLKQKAGPAYSAGRKGRVSAPKNLKVNVPAGTAIYVVKVVTQGHFVALATEFTVAGGADDLPLVGLGGDPDDLPLVGLPPKGDEGLDDLPLVGLPPKAGDEDPDDLPLAALPPKPDTSTGTKTSGTNTGTGGETPSTTTTDSGTASGTGAVAMAPTGDPGRTVDVSTTEATPGSGTVVGQPLHEGPRTPRVRKPGRLVLGLRGLAAQSGLGAGVLGGGLELLLRPVAGSGMLVGVTADFLPQRLYSELTYPSGDVQRFDVSLRSIPILLTGAYDLGSGRLRWQAQAGAGIALVTADRAGAPSSAVQPAFAASFGPKIGLGPGFATLSVRASGSYGGVDAAESELDQQEMMPATFLGALGLTLGYQLGI